MRATLPPCPCSFFERTPPARVAVPNGAAVNLWLSMPSDMANSAGASGLCQNACNSIAPLPYLSCAAIGTACVPLEASESLFPVATRTELETACSMQSSVIEDPSSCVAPSLCGAAGFKTGKARVDGTPAGCPQSSKSKCDATCTTGASAMPPDTSSCTQQCQICNTPDAASCLEGTYNDRNSAASCYSACQESHSTRAPFFNFDTTTQECKCLGPCATEVDDANAVSGMICVRECASNSNSDHINGWDLGGDYASIGNMFTADDFGGGPHFNNLGSASACQRSCGSEPLARWFMYNSGADDCWCKYNNDIQEYPVTPSIHTIGPSCRERCPGGMTMFHWFLDTPTPSPEWAAVVVIDSAAGMQMTECPGWCAQTLTTDCKARNALLGSKNGEMHCGFDGDTTMCRLWAGSEIFSKFHVTATDSRSTGAYHANTGPCVVALDEVTACEPSADDACAISTIPIAEANTACADVTPVALFNQCVFDYCASGDDGYPSMYKKISKISETENQPPSAPSAAPSSAPSAAPSVSPSAVRPTQTPTQMGVQSGAAGASGDPHMYAATGDQYDFRGEHDEVYNLLSHTNISVNALFQNADYREAGPKRRLVHGSYMRACFVTAWTNASSTYRITYASNRTTELQVHSVSPMGGSTEKPVVYRLNSRHGVGATVDGGVAWARDDLRVTLSPQREFVVSSPEWNVRVMAKVRSVG